MSTIHNDPTLPIHHTYETIVINGIRYKSYAETDWDQILTEPNVTLHEYLDGISGLTLDNYFNLKGTLLSNNESTGMEKLYAVTGMKVGDIYKVESDILDEAGIIYELYVWTGTTGGWMYSGTSNNSLTIKQLLPAVIQKFPTEMGDAGQVLAVGADGQTLSWVSISEATGIEEHNINPDAHPIILEALNNKSNVNRYLTTTLLSSNWVLNITRNQYEYSIITSFIKDFTVQVIPIYSTIAERSAIMSIGIDPLVDIQTIGVDPVIILRADRLPTIDIQIAAVLISVLDPPTPTPPEP